jgi:hypothetical protein
MKPRKLHSENNPINCNKKSKPNTTSKENKENDYNYQNTNNKVLKKTDNTAKNNNKKQNRMDDKALKALAYLNPARNAKTNAIQRTQMQLHAE